MDDLIYPAASGRGGVIGQTVHPVPPEQRGKPEAELPDEQLKAHGERLRKRLKYFHAQQKTHIKRWEKNRKFVNGEENDDGEKGLVRVNLTASVVNTIQPNIYAKAPEVSVQPEERIDPGEYQQVRGFAKTLELVLNRYAIRGTQLKARGKEAVRASLTCTTGWVKVIFQRDKREDPLVRNRINDAQDNIQRIEQLLRETKDEGAGENYKANLAELRQQIEALEGQVEVVVSEGLVIDNVQPDHVLILDASVKTIDEYAQASGIAHGVYMTVRTYKAQFGGKEPPQKATRYSSGEQTETDTARKEGMDPDDELVLVWEVWSKDDLTVYTQCAGASEYCRDPYQPQTLGAQWYPFFPLQLWRVNGLLYARALVDNLIELIDEYNTRRTVAAEHRRKNMPVRLLNKGSGITDADVERINSRGAGTDVIAIEADPEKPLSNQLGQLAEIAYNRDMYDTTDILRDIEMVSGAQDASRGGVNQAKTATEAEIMAMGMQSRTSEQLDTIEDWLTAILAYCAQLLLQNLTPEQVKAKFGQSAVWPDLSKKELFEQVMVLIRAGSTSKPNKMRERDQWLQFMPQMQEAVMRIAELQAQGQAELAESLMKMLDETLRRFDERLSIEEFVPGQGEGEEGQPNSQKMLQMVQQKVQELTQQAEEALAQQREELEKQQAALTERETTLRIEEIEQAAAKEVAGIRSQYDEALRKVKDREAANAVTEKVQQLLQQHEQRVQQMLAGPDPQQQFDEMRASLLQEVEALVTGLMQPPAEEQSAVLIQEPAQF